MPFSQTMLFFFSKNTDYKTVIRLFCQSAYYVIVTLLKLVILWSTLYCSLPWRPELFELFKKDSALASFFVLFSFSIFYTGVILS